MCRGVGRHCAGLLTVYRKPCAPLIGVRRVLRAWDGAEKWSGPGDDRPARNFTRRERGVPLPGLVAGAARVLATRGLEARGEARGAVAVLGRALGDLGEVGRPDLVAGRGWSGDEEAAHLAAVRDADVAAD